MTAFAPWECRSELSDAESGEQINVDVQAADALLPVALRDVIRIVA